MEATVDPLTSKQRAFLRSRAHPLKPVLQVGNEGVTGVVLRSLAEAFNTRELLKVKVLQSAPEGAGETGAALADGVPGVHLVQVIGRTIVLYRPLPEEPEIQLPG